MQDLSKPCMLGRHYYEPDGFEKQLKQLNRVLGSLHEWRWRKARKNHEDDFGRPIQQYEHYLARGDWGDTERLSVESAMSLFSVMGIVTDSSQFIGSLCSYVTEGMRHTLWERRRQGMGSE